MNAPLPFFLRVLTVLLLVAVPGLAHASFGATSTPLNVPSAAYPTIQSGVNAAHDGDTVLVADGTYSGPGNRDIDFNGKNITVTSQNGPTKTIIDCGGTFSTDGLGNHRGFYIHSGETAATISGFTVKNGYETYISAGNNPVTSSRGGGICIYESIIQYRTISILDCNFLGDMVRNEGGGVYAANAGNGMTTITDCNFSGNAAIDSGGGVASENDGSVATNLIDCTFNANTAASGAGVLNWNNGAGTTTLTNCSLNGNIAQAYGGGIYNENYQGNGKIALTNCTLNNNAAIFSDQNNGGGVYDGSENDGGIITLTNDVLYGNTGGELRYDATTTSSEVINHSDIQGGYTGTGNIDKDPMFVNASAGDLHLKPGSPCIGAGTPDGAPATDLDGNPRPNPPSMRAYDAPGTPLYILTDLGLLGGAASYGLGINNSGQVVGYISHPGNDFFFSQEMAYKWINGQVTYLNPLPNGIGSEAIAISNSGAVAGLSNVGAGQAPYDAVIWNPGAPPIDLKTLSGSYSYPSSINDKGQVAGASGFSNYSAETHAFVYMNGVLTDIDSLNNSQYSLAKGINNTGQAVGLYNQYGSGEYAFYYDGLASKDLNDPTVTSDNAGLTYLYTADGINDIGQICGTGEDKQYNATFEEAFIWQEGKIKLLSWLSGDVGSHAIAMNTLGQVIGYSDAKPSATHPFLYLNGLMYGIDDLIADHKGLGNLTLSAINDSGEIVGTGLLDNVSHAFLLSPVGIPPATLTNFTLSPNQIAAPGPTVTVNVSVTGNFAKVTVSPAPGSLSIATPTFNLLTNSGGGWGGSFSTAFLKLAKTNPVTFIATGTRVDGTTAQLSAPLIIGALPTLSLAVSSDKSAVPAGLTFSIRGFVRNLSATAANPVTVTIPIPAHLTFDSSPDFTLNTAQNTVTWTGVLPANTGSHAIYVEFIASANTPANTLITINTTATATNFQSAVQASSIVVGSPPVPLGVDIDSSGAYGQADGTAIITSDVGTAPLLATISPVSGLNHAWLGVDHAYDASGGPLPPTKDLSIGTLAAIDGLVGPGVSPTYLGTFPRVGSQCNIRLRLTYPSAVMNSANIAISALGGIFGQGDVDPAGVIESYNDLAQIQAFQDVAGILQHPADNFFERIGQVHSVVQDFLAISPPDEDKLAPILSKLFKKTIKPTDIAKHLKIFAAGEAIFGIEQILQDEIIFTAVTGGADAEVTFTGSAGPHPEELR